MSLTVLILQTVLFCLTFWLGCYLIARDPGRLHLWLAGLRMITFTTGIAAVLLGEFAPSASMALTLYWFSWYTVACAPICPTRL
jgi:hypothetical protein